jgi:hypothetical protein
MNAFRAVLLGAALLLGSGCRAAVTNESAPSNPRTWEEMHVDYARRLQHWRWAGDDPTVDPPPANAVRVPVTVDRVDIPTRVTESLTQSTRGTVTFSVRAGYLPFAPNCTRIVMTFEARINPFMDGAVHELAFMPDGRFWGGGSFNF